MTDKNEKDAKACQKKIMAIGDAMYVLGGKWKMHIVASLSYGEKRFSDLLADIENISGKMLSRELKEMETNMLISRTVMDTRPITVQYELTDYGKKLYPIIDNLVEWGLEHRKKITQKSND